MPQERSLSLLVCPKDSPALTNSGYGKMTRYLVPYLLDAGYDLRLHCPQGHLYNIMNWEEPRTKRPVQIWTGGSGAYGEDMMGPHLERLSNESGKPSMVFFIGDVAALGPLAQAAKERQVLACAWGAVDWESPTPNFVLDKFGSFVHVWPMSHHGYKVLTQDGCPNVLPPVWLGVDTDVFKPLPKADLEKTRASMKFTDDGFNIVSVFANQFQRKGEYEMFAAIGEFHKRHPEAKVRFFAMTQVRREWDLHALAAHLGIGDLVGFSGDYAYHMGDYSDQDVARMFNAADVALSIGYEGFGLQTVESQACGIPVIGFNAAATPEIMKSGVMIPPDKELMTPTLIRKVLPSGAHLVEALEQVWDKKQRGEKWPDAIPWIKENLSWDKIGAQVVDRLARTEQQIADEELVGPPAPGPMADVLRAKVFRV